MRSLSPSTTAKLFATGCTIGPIVDSLHNQCLLQYNVLPISLAWPTESLAKFSNYPFFFCSSWTVPPLLGIAYVVLGGILPRLLENLLRIDTDSPQIFSQTSLTSSLRKKAWIAVMTTALIIQLSEFLQTHPNIVTTMVTGSVDGVGAGVGAGDSEALVHVLVMLVAALAQWALLDGSLTALLAASITSIGGPLSELPFVAHGVWEYLPSASDYFPLATNILPSASSTTHANSFVNVVATFLLGENYQDLALSSITGPCYFAVTMDAIALGRWLDMELDNPGKNSGGGSSSGSGTSTTTSEVLQ